MERMWLLWARCEGYEVCNESQCSQSTATSPLFTTCLAQGGVYKSLDLCKRTQDPVLLHMSPAIVGRSQDFSRQINHPDEMKENSTFPVSINTEQCCFTKTTPPQGRKTISPDMIEKKRWRQRLKLAEKKGRETFKEETVRTVLWPSLLI